MSKLSFGGIALLTFFTLLSPSFGKDRIVTCLIEVKNHVYLLGPCNFSPDKDGSFSIGTSDTRPSDYFAYVNKNEDGTAEAFWNEEPQASHAHTSLGTVKQDGPCWVNDHAKICAK